MKRMYWILAAVFVLGAIVVYKNKSGEAYGKTFWEQASKTGYGI